MELGKRYGGVIGARWLLSNWRTRGLDTMKIIAIQDYAVPEPNASYVRKVGTATEVC